MPESRVRRKAAFIAPPPKSAGPKPNPRWWAPVMVGLMVVGLIYIVVFYLTQQEFPIKAIGHLEPGRRVRGDDGRVRHDTKWR